MPSTAPDLDGRRYLLHAAAAAFLAQTTAMKPAHATSPVPAGLELTPIDSFSVVRMRGQRFLVVELLVRNAGPEPVRLRRLTVASPDGSASLAVEGEALRAAGAMPDGRLAPSLVVEAADHRSLYLWHVLAAEAGEPKSLQLTASSGLSVGESLKASIGIGPLQQPIALSPPLRRGPWVAVFDPWFPFGHRRSAFVRQGQRFIPARFAIDWIRLDSRGSPWPGDRAGFEHWHGLNHDVLAVADGEIVALRDDREDILTRTRPRERWADEDVAGNYLCLRVADDRYVFYEHLRKGSITRQVGDRVRTGDVVAGVGRSGINSSGPHLHLHVADRPELIFAQGRPFVIKAYDHIGEYPGMQAAESGRAWTPLESQRRHRIEGELPAPNSVLRFID